MNSVISPNSGRTYRRMDPVVMKFALIQIALYAPFAASSYTSAYMQDAGFTATDIGIVMSLMNVAAIMSPPFWGMLSDRLRSLRKVLFICLAGGAVLFSITPFVRTASILSVGLIFISLPVANFFRAPVGALTDSWTVCASKKNPNLVYGRVRLWGSIAYALAVYIIGLFNNWFSSYGYTFVLYGLLCVPLCVICLLPQEDYAPPRMTGTGGSIRDMQFSRLFRNYHYITYLLLTTFLHFTFLSFITFLPYLFLDISGSRELLGISFCFKALGEIPILFLAHHILKRLGMTKSIIALGVLFAAIQFVFAVISSNLLVIVFIFVYGMGFGLFCAVNAHYVYMITPPELNATAMTVVGALGSIAGVLCNLWGGILVDAIGIRGFFLVTGVIITAGAMIFTLSVPFGKHLQKVKERHILYKL